MKQTYSGSCHCGAIRFQAVLGLAPAGERSSPERPGVWWTTTFRCVNVSCLDGVDERLLAAAPVAYEDGRNDAWNRAPAVTRHLQRAAACPRS